MLEQNQEQKPKTKERFGHKPRLENDKSKIAFVEIANEQQIK